MTETPKPRQTRQRGVVREALHAQGGFTSAQSLHTRLRELGETIGLATVYRTLQSLVDAEEADSIRTPEGEMHYRSCATPHHHHHLICRGCGATVELVGGPVEAWASEVGAEHGYLDISHEVEIYGLCSVCAAKSE